MIRAEAEGLAGRGHDTIKCIVTWKGLAVGKIRSRYKDCIMTRRKLEAGRCVATQGHDTAQGRATRPRYSLLCAATRPKRGHDTAGGARP